MCTLHFTGVCKAITRFQISSRFAIFNLSALKMTLMTSVEAEVADELPREASVVEARHCEPPRPRKPLEQLVVTHVVVE